MKNGTVEGLIKRMMEATGSAREKNLARLIGVSPQAMSNAKRKNAIPPAWVMSIAIHYEVSLDWLYFAKGDKLSQEEEGNLRIQLVQKEARIAELEKELALAQAEALRAYKLVVDAMHQGLKPQDQASQMRAEPAECRNNNLLQR